MASPSRRRATNRRRSSSTLHSFHGTDASSAKDRKCSLCVRNEVQPLSREAHRTELFATSDIVTLHCALTPDTHHLVDTSCLGQMKRGMMLINNSRGAVFDTRAVIRGLKEGTVGSLGLDVYEEEADPLFEMSLTTSPPRRC